MAGGVARRKDRVERRTRRSLTQQKERHGMDSQIQRWLTMWVGDVPLALPLDRVREVLLWVRGEPVPPERRGMVGMLSMRDEACPVWDIRQVWGWRARQPDAETCLVLLNWPDGALCGCVVVDRSGWVTDCNAIPVAGETDIEQQGKVGHMFEYAI